MPKQETLPSSCGRLIVVAERRLTPATRIALRNLLGDIVLSRDLTFVAGLTRSATIDAGREGGPVFYNSCEHIPLPQAIDMVPWKEVWLVASGKVWRAV